jgi:hypothetical protein
VMSSVPSIMTVKETIAQQCRDLNVDALTRLRHQLGLYVHPVVRGSEHIGRESIRNEQSPGFFTQTRNIDAELRSVFTMFITAKLSSALSTDKDNKDKDFELFRTLSHIMSITSRELDRFSGHLRQFIVDDKGNLQVYHTSSGHSFCHITCLETNYYLLLCLFSCVIHYNACRCQPQVWFLSQPLDCEVPRSQTCKCNQN